MNWQLKRQQASTSAVRYFQLVRVNGDKALIAGAGALLLLNPMLPMAADWQFVPRVEFGATYDDNYRLSEVEAEQIEVSGGILDATLGISGRTTTTDFDLTPRIQSTYFPSESDQDSTDGSLGVSVGHRGQKSKIGLAAEYTDESVIRSEIPDTEFSPELGDIDGDNTGVVTIRNRRYRVLVRPTASVELTERSALAFSARYNDTDYQKFISGSQEDFTDVYGTLGFDYRLQPLSTVGLAVSAGRHTPDRSGKDSTRYEAVARWSTQPSETRRWYVQAGAVQTDFDAVANQPSASETGYVGTAGIDWTFQVTRVFLDFTHNVVPSSAGNVRELDELRMRVTRELTQRLSIGMAGRVMQLNEVSDTTEGNDREYVIGSLGVAWRLGRSWSLAAKYEYSWRSFEQDSADAHSNAVTLGLVYEPERRR